jgi:hypothetical protein
LIMGNKYLLFRTYINEARATPGGKYLLLLTKGGNVVNKYTVNTKPIDLLTELLNRIKDL